MQADENYPGDLTWNWDTGPSVYRGIFSSDQSAYKKTTLLPVAAFCGSKFIRLGIETDGIQEISGRPHHCGAGKWEIHHDCRNAAYSLTKDGERGAEVYCLANAKDQARTVF